MTRHYANVGTGIWRERDFRSLSSSAQRTLFLLQTQPDITAVGVLPLTVGRWAGLASDTTPDTIRTDLKELAAGGFLVVDEYSEEVLVRSFVRDDKGYSNPKRKPVIRRAAQEVISAALRQALEAEFESLGLSIETLRQLPGPDHASSQANRLSGSQSSSPYESHPGSEPDAVSASDGVVVTKALDVRTPTHTPHPPPPPATAAPAATGAAEPGEGEADDAQLIADLVREIRLTRPEWTVRSITQAVSEDEVAERPWAIVAAAMRLVAEDPTSQAPGRLRGDGPWWAKAAHQERRPKAATQPRKPCALCSDTKTIAETVDTRTGNVGDFASIPPEFRRERARTCACRTATAAAGVTP